MKTLKQTLGISLLLISLLTSGQVLGQKQNTNGNGGIKTERNYSKDRLNSSHYDYSGRHRTQPIRRNPHYRYPHHRRVVRTLPRHHVRVVYRGLPYFYYSGIYYTLIGEEYIIVIPPRGFRIATLPVGYVRIVIGLSVYFYHSGVYYLETTTTSTESEGKYEVTQPPVGVILNEISDDAEEVYIEGNVFYEYNDVLYKKETDSNKKTTYEVVYCKPNND